MDKDKIIQQGTVAKWMIDITRDDFDMETDDFAVTLLWGYSGKTKTIPKSDMGVDGGVYTFTLDTTGIIGPITAQCVLNIPEIDGIGTVAVVDRQFIGFSTDSPCPKFQEPCSCSCGDGDVTYRRLVQESYTMYFGSGSAYTDVAQSAQIPADPAGAYTVDVLHDGDKVFFIVPAASTITSATMSNFTFPLEPPYNVELNAESYKVYESSNTYDAGTYDITLN